MQGIAMNAARRILDRFHDGAGHYTFVRCVDARGDCWPLDYTVEAAWPANG